MGGDEKVLAAIGELRYLVEQQGQRYETIIEHVDGLKDLVMGVLHRVATAERIARDAREVATEAVGAASEARIKAAEAHRVATEAVEAAGRATEAAGKGVEAHQIATTAAAEAARAHERLDQIPAARRSWPWWLEILAGLFVGGTGIGIGSLL